MKKNFPSIALYAVILFGSVTGTTSVVAGPKKGEMTTKGILTLYSGQKFQGDYVEVKKMRVTMTTDFSIGSIAVYEGDKWEVCEGEKFKGYCEIITANKTDLGKVTVRSARQIVDPKPAN
jgi:hypothetical protein